MSWTTRLGSSSVIEASASIANDAVDGASAEEDGIYVITVMVTDPSGESGESTDTKVVVITATDVDEIPEREGRRTALTAPDHGSYGRRERKPSRRGRPSLTKH